MCINSEISVKKFCALLCVSWILSACVSDTLSVENTQVAPTPVVQNAAQTTGATQPTDTSNASYDPIQRAQAVAEIRAKADNSSTPGLTNAYTVSEGSTRPLTAEEQAAKLAEINRTVEAKNLGISDAELEAKQRSIRELQARGQNHYEKAVTTIQN